MVNNFGTGSITGKFKNPYQFSAGSVDADTSEALYQALKTRNRMQSELTQERSMWDRVGDGLQVGNYTTANYVSDWVRMAKGEEDATFLKALNPIDDVISGVKASWMLGDGSRKDEKTYSAVLEEIGWKPTSGIGRFAKGALGFTGDVLLDPLTYLTGGVSAVIKGTGRVGQAVKVLDGVSTTYNGGAKMTHMTEEVASKIIKDSDTYKKLAPDDAQHASDVAQFAKNFNKQIGIYDVQKRPITLGVANLPFGDKLAPKLGVLGKTIKLSDGDNVRKLADTIGSARAYAGIRDSLYGSRIGKMFSTNHVYYKAATENPAQLYKFLAFANSTKGLALSKMDAEKLIRQKADEFGAFTAAERKEMVTLLEDKSIMSTINGTVKYAGTQHAKNMERFFKNKSGELAGEVDSLKSLRTQADNIEAIRATGKGGDEIEQLRRTLVQDMRKVSTDGASKEQLAELVSIAERNIGDINAQIAKVDGRVLSGSTGEEALSKLTKLVADSRAENEIAGVAQKLAGKNSAPSKAVDIDTKTGKAKVVKTGRDVDRMQSGNVSLKAREDLYEALSEVAYGHGKAFNLGSDKRIVSDVMPILEQLSGTAAKSSTFGDASAFVTANRGFFGDKPNAGQIKRFSEMIKNKDFEGLFNDYLTRNPRLVSEHAKGVNQYLARTLGYENFQKDILAPLRKLQQKKRGKPAEYTPQNAIDMARYSGIADARAKGMNKYFDNMSPEEFAQVDKIERLRKTNDEYIEMTELDDMRYARPDVQEVTPASKTDMYGNQAGDVIHTEGYVNKAVDPRGAFVSEAKHSKQDWDVFEDIGGGKFYYNKREYTHASGEIVPTNTRHKRGSKTIEPLANKVEPVESKVPRAPKPKSVTKTDLMSGNSLKSISNRVETYLTDTMLKRHKNDPVALRKAIGKSGAVIEKLSSDVAEVLLVKHPGKTLMDLTDEAEIKRVVGMAAKLSMHHKKPLTPALVRQGFETEAKSAKSLVDVEKYTELRKSLEPGRTIKATVDGKQVDGVIIGTRKDMEGLSKAEREAGSGQTVFTIRKGEETVDVRMSDDIELVPDARVKSVRELAREGSKLEELVQLRNKTQKELEDALNAKVKPLDVASAERAELRSTFKAKEDAILRDMEHMEQVSQNAINNIRETFGELGERAVKGMPDDVSAAEAIARLDKQIDSISDELRYIDDKMKTDEAFETLVRAHHGDKLVNKAIGAHNSDLSLGAKLALDDMASNKAVADYVKYLRETFKQAGKSEVAWGKLGEKQFNYMVDHYLPRVPTKDGQRFFNSNREIKSHGPMITADYGYGMKRNPFAKERTIEGETLAEANAIFHEAAKGKNVFSEEISDIYITRMLKHEELRYDQEYMRNMMERFGDDIVGDTAKEGYKAVANYGMLRKQFTDEASTAMSQRMKDAKKNGKMEHTPEEHMLLFEEEVARVTEKYGFPLDVLDKSATPMVELTKEQIKRLKGLNLAKQVDDGIVQKANQARKLAIMKDEHASLQMYDKFLHFVKLYQTAIMPSFHVRNKMSNMFSNWLGVGRDAFDPKFQANAFKAVHYWDDVEKLRSIPPIITDDGLKVYHYDEIMYESRALGGIDDGYFARDIGAGAVSSGLFKNHVKPAWNPTDTGNFAPLQLGTRVGSSIENSDRVVHIASMLKQGKTMDEAVESSTKYLFDYSDLTAFEQGVMKRIFPYYTWMRKNMKLQMSELIEQPGKYAMIPKVENGIEGMNNQEELVDEAYTQDFQRDWIQTPFGINNKEGQREPLMLNPNLPFMDIAGLPDPFNIKDSAREFLSQTAPMIKVPIEQATNTNLFFNSPIVREGESQVGERLKHLGGQFAPFNAVDGATRSSDEKNALSALGSLTGIKLGAYNYEMSKREVLKNASYESDGPGFISSIANTVSGIADGVVAFSGAVASDAITSLVGAPPMGPESYSGSMMPISQHTYEGLSDAEKRKYTPPTDGQVTVYNNRAVELAEQARAEGGKATNFMWSIVDGINASKQPKVGHVSKVTDGDTFEIQYGDVTEKVRLRLVDTPETVHPNKPAELGGKEASDYSKKMLFGKDVRIVVDDVDQYGRVVAYVELDGNDYNRKLLEEGLAKVYTFDKKSPRTEDYYSAQEEAQRQEKGRWGR